MRLMAPSPIRQFSSQVLGGGTWVFPNFVQIVCITQPVQCRPPQSCRRKRSGITPA
jgi:hypothetical protein